MKRIIFITCTILVAVTLLCGCRNDRLQRAVIDGYDRAFTEADANEQIRLFDEDYENICAWFDTYAEDKPDPNSNDKEWRWEYIKGVLCEKYNEAEIGRIDETQWLGSRPALPLKVEVYLDNTSSMKGYIKHQHVDDRVFVDVFHAVDDYLFRGKEEVAVKSYYTQRNKDKKDEIVELPWNGDGGMKDQLDHDKMTGFTDSYKLNDFLDNIVSRMVADKKHRYLTFFITDGIPSGPNEKVKVGGTWNIDHATELKNQIRVIAQKLADNHGGISIYQFEGDFYGGNYWYHDNSNKAIASPIKRPFYVIVMGDADMTEQFKQEVENGLELFKPLHQVHFKEFEKEVSITVSDSNGNEAEIGKDEYVFFNMEEKKLSAFISIPFITLPSFFGSEDALTKVINLMVEGKKYDKYKVEKGKVVFGPIFLEENTRINSEISICNVSPSWTKAMNIKNDIIEGYEKGTFNFMVLIDGIREGFVGNEDILFNERLSIKRDN